MIYIISKRYIIYIKEIYQSKEYDGIDIDYIKRAHIIWDIFFCRSKDNKLASSSRNGDYKPVSLSRQTINLLR